MSILEITLIVLAVSGLITYTVIRIVSIKKNKKKKIEEQDEIREK